MILVAVWQYDSFSWTTKSLSDLGSEQEKAATLFNSSLVAAGVLAAIFAVGLKRNPPASRWAAVGPTALFVGALGLVTTGIFKSTEGVEYLVHYYTSGLFWALAIVSLLFIGSATMREPAQRRPGLVIFITGGFTSAAGIAAVMILQLSPWGVAIPEFLIALGVSVCYMILGVRLFRARPDRSSTQRSHNSEDS